MNTQNQLTTTDGPASSLALDPRSASVSDCAHALACADWVMRFREACDNAGGGSWESVKKMTVEDAMHLLAPNGIRFCFVESSHVSKLNDTAHAMKHALLFLPNTESSDCANQNG